MKRLLILHISLLIASCSIGQVRLPKLIRDSMILQRDAKVNVWGWASPNERVTVAFNKKKYTTKADGIGNWKVQLQPTKAGGPYTIDISGKNSITLKEVLFGDVWFCSGQSNMVHQMNIHDVSYASEIAEANYPQIRQFWVSTMTSLQGPQENLPSGYWTPAVGENLRPFSAVAYFFAKTIFEKYHVPIGIINASVGGTPIEAWTSEEGLKDFPSITAVIQKNKDTAYTNRFNKTPSANASKPPADAGLAGNTKWYDISYAPKGWRNINIPGYWEDQGLKDLNGVVWYRREIDIPASMAGKPGKIFLGRIIDADELYVNGKMIGNTGSQYPQRRYSLPAYALRPGKNIFVVRVTNASGKGGFVPDKPYCLFTGSDTVDLKGSWKYKVGEVFAPIGSGSDIGVLSFQHQPAALYNAMVAPLANYTIKGFCWYQGESNAGKPDEYIRLQPAIVKDWRNKWNQGNLPFLYVQLPGFMEYNYLPSESNWAVIRAAQLSALSVANTAMVVAIDLGEWNDIHPDNKKMVGQRLALAAFKNAYGENIVHSGPLYQSYTLDGNKVSISFTNSGSGLISNDGEALSEFAVAGADKKFVWAKAKIEGDKVIVWADGVDTPVYLRYAWAFNPVNPNLYNNEGLPASPFQINISGK